MRNGMIEMSVTINH